MRTRLTDLFILTLPILSAPMAGAGGGALAAAVSRAGGLGFIGGGYGDPVWIEQQMTLAGDTPVGVGLISWKLADNPAVLDQVLAAKPAALFLSFGDPAEYVPAIRAAGVPLILQVQSLRDAQHAADLGADVIVAQGAEAGGHGESRATMTLVPEVADWLAGSGSGSEAVLVAAGGIADGRGLAASLMLGAEGAVMGTRLYASDESLAHDNMIAASVAASGDDSLRTSVPDMARRLRWPGRYSVRVLKNAFTRRWQGDMAGLADAIEVEAPRWVAAQAAGDTEVANTIVGEAAGLIRDRCPAAQIIQETADQAEALMARFGSQEET
nr:nitronate monooxygenase [Candidatus Halocynthiibacter alkanivorans]